MLDYDFLDKCVDPDLIRAIVRKLRSGEEGHYPHLIKVQKHTYTTVAPSQCPSPSEPMEGLISCDLSSTSCICATPRAFVTSKHCENILNNK